MRTILIDPVANTVTEHTLPDSGKGNLHSFYDVLNCDLVDYVSLGNNVDLWVDDEGALKDAAERGYFVVHNMGRGHRLIAGRGLVVGHDEDGNSTSIPDRVTVDMIKRHILFFHPNDVAQAVDLMDQITSLNGWVESREDLAARQSEMVLIMEKAVHYATINPNAKPAPAKASQTHAPTGWCWIEN